MLKRLYGMSDEGYKQTKKSIFICFLFNLALIVPVGMFFMLITHVLTPYIEKTDNQMISFAFYTGIAVALTVVIFFMQKVKYTATYVSTYEESANTRISLAEKIRQLPLAYLTRKDVSELSYTMMNDVTTIEHAVSHAVLEAVAIILTLILAFISLLFLNPILSIATFLFVPIGILIFVLARKMQKKMSRQHAEAKIAMSDKTQEILDNIQVIKANHLGDNFQGQLNRLGKIVIKKSIKGELMVGSVVMSIQFVMRLGMLAVILIGSSLITRGEVDLLTYILFVFIGTRIFEPLNTVFMMMAEMVHAVTSSERIQGLQNQPELTGKEEVRFDDYNIQLDHVTFAYNRETVIDDLSVTIKQNQVTALVGPSGSGKSTLAKLVARFWDIQSGTITIGGQDIAAIDSDELLKSFSVVFQDVVLFNDTIYNNIAIGRRGATEEEVYQAARNAQCMEFIDKLPNGMQSEIGENGYTLSGGERQRLSIARALLKDAPVILLDEATASIDPENETLIQQAFGRLIQDKTVIIIAHRLRTIQDADQIIVLEEGKIAEQGRHDELIKNNGIYQHMYSLQHESDQWKVKQTFA